MLKKKKDSLAWVSKGSYMHVDLKFYHWKSTSLVMNFFKIYVIVSFVSKKAFIVPIYENFYFNFVQSS